MNSEGTSDGLDYRKADITAQTTFQFLLDGTIFPQLFWIGSRKANSVIGTSLRPHACCMPNLQWQSKSNTKLEKAAQGVAQCKVSAYVPSCRHCVATYWKEQAWRSQNFKYLT